MNTLFLLLVGVVILAMGHRYWVRLLEVVVLAPARSTPGPGIADRARHGLGDTGHRTASAATLMPLFGAALGLAWGWAPGFVWVLLGGGLVGTLVCAASRWIESAAGDSGGDPLAAAAGAATARLARLTRWSALVLLMPIAATTLVAIITTYPLAGAVLATLAATAFAFHKPIGAAAAGAAIAYAASAFALLPLAVTAVAVLAPETSMAARSVEAPIAGPGILALLVALVLQRLDDLRIARPLGLFAAAPLVLLLAIVALALALQHADAGYPVYFRPDAAPPAMPLLAVLFGLGIYALLPAGRRGPRPRTAAPAPSAFESLFALAVLLVLAAAAGQSLPAPAGLPDWDHGIDPIAITTYFAAATAALGVLLPFPPAALELFVASVVAVLAWVFLDNVVAASRGLAVEVLSPRPAVPLLVDLGLLIAGAGGISLLAAFGIPFALWVVIGLLMILYLGTTLAIAGLGLRRLRRGAVMVLAAAAIASLGFWISGVERVVALAAAGQWGWVAAIIVVMCLGTLVSLHLWRAHRAVKPHS